MTITAATSADWVDFWENEMPSNVEMNQDQISAMLTVCENIQEQIEIAGELWEMTTLKSMLYVVSLLMHLLSRVSRWRHLFDGDNSSNLHHQCNN